ncbi:MAG: MFS transporter [Mangrovibacterium sp.]
MFESKLPFGAWRVVALLFFVGALNYIDRTMIVTMRSSIIDSIPMSDAQFGLLTSIFLWIYGLLSPVAGFLADRFKRSHVIIGSLFIWSAVTWLTAHATTYGELLATRALMGVSEAFYIPAALALIVDYHRGPTRSLATGINLAGAMAGQTLGFIGGWLAEHHSWNYAFNLMGIIGVTYALTLIFLLKDIKRSEHSSRDKSDTVFTEAIHILFKQKSFVCLLLSFGLMGIVTWTVVGWLPTYYLEKFHLSQGVSGLYATTYLYPASIAGLLLGGFLADRWSISNPLARVLIPIIGLSVAAFFIVMATLSDVLILTVLFFLIFGLTKMFFDTNVMPALCIMVDSRYRATGYGVMNMLSTIIGGIGIYAAGWLRDSDIDLNLAYRFATLIMAICIGLLYIAMQQIKKQVSS